MESNHRPPPATPEQAHACDGGRVYLTAPDFALALRVGGIEPPTSILSG